MTEKDIIAMEGVKTGRKVIVNDIGTFVESTDHEDFKKSIKEYAGRHQEKPTIVYVPKNNDLIVVRMIKPNGQAYVQFVCEKALLHNLKDEMALEQLNVLPDGCSIEQHPNLSSGSFLLRGTRPRGVLFDPEILHQSFFLRPAGSPMFNGAGNLIGETTDQANKRPWLSGMLGVEL